MEPASLATLGHLRCPRRTNKVLRSFTRLTAWSKLQTAPVLDCPIFTAHISQHRGFCEGSRTARLRRLRRWISSSRVLNKDGDSRFTEKTRSSRSKSRLCHGMVKRLRTEGTGANSRTAHACCGSCDSSGAISDSRRAHSKPRNTTHPPDAAIRWLVATSMRYQAAQKQKLKARLKSTQRTTEYR